MLVLVLDEQLPQEAAGVEIAEAGGEVHPVEHAQRPLAHGGHVRERLRVAQVGHLASLGARRLGCVVHLHQVGPQRRHAGAAPGHPQVLEGGDVPQVPDERAHQRVVHALEVGLIDGLRQPHRPLARVREQDADPLAEQRLSPSKGHCYWVEGRHLFRDGSCWVRPTTWNVTGLDRPAARSGT